MNAYVMKYYEHHDVAILMGGIAMIFCIYYIIRFIFLKESFLNIFGFVFMFIGISLFFIRRFILYFDFKDYEIYQYDIWGLGCIFFIMSIVSWTINGYKSRDEKERRKVKSDLIFLACFTAVVILLLFFRK